MPTTTSKPSLFIGLMSGTSLDGVDAALVDFGDSRPQLLATTYLPYPAHLVPLLLELHTARSGELDRAATLANQLAQLYATTVATLLRQSAHPASAILAIGNHGQTIRHCPEAGYTLQIGNNALLAELTGIDVIGDFRSRDIAAGGQGAPLVPAFHQAVFGSTASTRVILNIGGIANISYLPTDGNVFGFDTGPGNLLLDAWIREYQGQAYDRDGAWARSGQLIPALLSALLSEPYCEQAPPKSTGRDLFNLAWLQRRLNPEWSAVDVQATLLAFTSHSIARAIRRFCPACDEILVCGGGARNTALMDDLQMQLPDIPVGTTSQLGIDPDWVEAAAFAWLAYRFVDRQPGNLAKVTGARGPRVLGALYPR